MEKTERNTQKGSEMKRERKIGMAQIRKKRQRERKEEKEREKRSERQRKGRGVILKKTMIGRQNYKNKIKKGGKKVKEGKKERYRIKHLYILHNIA